MTFRKKIYLSCLLASSFLSDPIIAMIDSEENPETNRNSIGKLDVQNHAEIEYNKDICDSNKFPREVKFDEVLKQFNEWHKLDTKEERNTNKYALGLLNHVKEQKWHKALLTKEDISHVILPWHLSEGKFELVPETGLTVKETVNKLNKHLQNKEDKEHMDICLKKIEKQLEFHLQNKSSPIFLTTYNSKVWGKINKGKGLVHLDGLHRMISWSLHNDMLKDSKTLTAYIAGSFEDLETALYKNEINIFEKEREKNEEKKDINLQSCPDYNELEEEQLQEIDDIQATIQSNANEFGISTNSIRKRENTNNN